MGKNSNKYFVMSGCEFTSYRNSVWLVSWTDKRNDKTAIFGAVSTAQILGSGLSFSVFRGMHNVRRCYNKWCFAGEKNVSRILPHSHPFGKRQFASKS